MLRPLIDSIYDYRMATDSFNSSTRNSFKHHFLQTCALTSSANILSISSQNFNLETAIANWNHKHDEEALQKRQRGDFKTRLDWTFKAMSKGWYRGREYQRLKDSRQRSEDYKQSRYETYYIARNREPSYFHQYQRHDSSHKNEPHSSKYYRY